MKEKNTRTLRQALDNLPEHHAPDGVWQGIQRGLTPPLSERLPSYQPPAAVWNSLSEDLARTRVQAEEEKEQRSATTRRLPTRWLAIAASLLLIAALGYGLATRDTGPTITYARTQEVAPAVAEPDWDRDEESFANVLTQLDEVDEPELNTLKMELDELTAAKEDVKAILVAYGEDPRVVRQLAEIERDRSDVYRRIIVLL